MLSQPPRMDTLFEIANMADSDSRQRPDFRQFDPQHPIKGPFTRIRISWTEGKEALDKNIEGQGFSVYEIPVFVELGECQYDMAVAVSSLDKFGGIYRCKIMHPFTLPDPLCKSRSWLETIEKVIKGYDEAILAGAWGGMEVWLENQKSQFQGLRRAFIQATEI